MSDWRQTLAENEWLRDSLTIAELLDQKKALQVRCLDVRPLTPLQDYMIIASGTSFVQLDALAEAVDEAMSDLGVERKGSRIHREEDPWLVLDYGFVVVHLFKVETRVFYNLDNLWADAEVVYTSRDPDLVSAGSA